MVILQHILRIIVGLVFILSALAKLFPIEPFELIFMDLGLSNWLLAPFIARFVIAFEITLGLCIVFNLWLNNYIYKIALASLFIFTAYLLFILITKGNDVDCGCFGQYIYLTPIQSILKNVALIILLFLIKRKVPKIKWFNWLIIPFLGIGFTSTFLLNRVGLQNARAITINKTVNFSNFPTTYFTHQKIDFSKGKKIVAFFSHSCPHCESVAHKLAFLQKKYEINNLYVVLLSKHEENISVFLEKTKIDFPLIWFDDYDFFKYSGPSVPNMVYLEDGVLKKRWKGEFFDVEEFEEVLKIGV